MWALFSITLIILPDFIFYSRAYVIYQLNVDDEQNYEISCMEISKAGFALPLRDDKPHLPELISDTLNFFEKFLPLLSEDSPSPRNSVHPVQVFNQELKEKITKFLKRDPEKEKEIETEGFAFDDVVLIMIHRYDIFLEEQSDMERLYQNGMRQLKIKRGHPVPQRPQRPLNERSMVDESIFENVLGIALDTVDDAPKSVNHVVYESTTDKETTTTSQESEMESKLYPSIAAGIKMNIFRVLLKRALIILPESDRTLGRVGGQWWPNERCFSGNI